MNGRQDKYNAENKQKILVLRASRDQAAALNTNRPYNTGFAGSLGRHIALPSPRPALLMPESNISTAKKGVKLSRLGRPPGSKCAEARHRTSC